VKSREGEAKTVEELKVKLEGMIKESSIGRRDNNVMLDKLANLEEVHKVDLDTIRSLDFKLKQQEGEIFRNDELYKVNMDKLMNEHNSKLSDLERRLDVRVKELLRDNDGLQKRNQDLDLQIRHLSEDLRNYEYYKTEDIRETTVRIREEEKNRAQGNLRKYEADLRKYEEENLRIRRDYDTAVSEFRVIEGRLNDRAAHLEEEVRRLKGEVNTNIEQYNRERLRNESLSNEHLIKEGQTNKMEGEIRELQKTLQTKEVLNREHVEQLNREYEDERVRWEESRSTQTSRLADLEKQLRQSQSELSKLRQDFQRLQEMMTSNLTQAVHRTFSEFRLMA